MLQQSHIPLAHAVYSAQIGLWRHKDRSRVQRCMHCVTISAMELMRLPK